MSDCNKCSLSYFAELNILLTALVGIIVAIVAVLIGIGILVLILLLRRRKKKKKNVAPSAGTNTMHASSTSLQELLAISRDDASLKGSQSTLKGSQNTLKGSQNLLARSQSVLRHSQIPFNELIIEKEIGMGSYGRVCLGRWNHGPVALKFCRKKENIDDFAQEVRVMIELPPHPNVVQMFGISVDGPEAVIILEY